MAITTFISNLHKRLRSLGYSSAQKKMEHWKATVGAAKTHLYLFYGFNKQHTKLAQLVKFYETVYGYFLKLSEERYELEKQLYRIDYGQYTKARQALRDVTTRINMIANGKAPTVENIYIDNIPVVYWEWLRDISKTSFDIDYIDYIDAKAEQILHFERDLWIQFLKDVEDAIPSY